MSLHTAIRSQEDLVNHLRSGNWLSKANAIEAFRAVDRKLFAPSATEAYEGHPLSLNVPGATISAPDIHALAANHLSEHMGPGARVLDIGSGSGYLTAVFAHMLKQSGGEYTVGIENRDVLTEMGRRNLEHARPDLADHVVFLTGNGMEGCPEHAPFDAIHVGAAIPSETAMKKIAQQLKPGGRMVAPVEQPGRGQQMMVVDRDEDGKFKERSILSVIFVPLQEG